MYHYRVLKLIIVRRAAITCCVAMLQETEGLQESKFQGAKQVRHSGPRQAAESALPEHVRPAGQRTGELSSLY